MCVDGDWKPSASVYMCYPRHIITIPLLLGFVTVCCFVIITVIVLRQKRIRKFSQEVETELRLLNKVYDFDAFVSYSSKDGDFVEDVFLSKLEPSYKLCIHGRDFLPGTAVVRKYYGKFTKKCHVFYYVIRLIYSKSLVHS